MSFIRVYDGNLRPLTELDNITELSITRRYYEPGQWEVSMPYFDGIQEVINQGVYFLVENNPKKVGLLENVSIDDSRAAEITLSGATLSGVLKRRIIAPPDGDNYYRVDNTSAEGIMYEFLISQCVLPTDWRRIFPLLQTSWSKGRGGVTNWRANYGSFLSETLTDIGIYSGLGYDVYLDIPGGRWVFEVINGCDLTQTQNVNPNVIFSTRLDNLSSVAYEQNLLDYKNSVYTLMGNLDQNDFTVYVSRDLGMAGMELREMYFDAGSAAENVEELKRVGESKLKEKVVTEILTGNILDTNSFKYEKDWFLGDIVTVVHTKAGKILHERITEVTEIYQHNRSWLEVVFGIDKGDPARKIEAIERKVR